jgi:MinD-like ATPase involved in chromosome partitioning or flagellar assembly
VQVAGGSGTSAAAAAVAAALAARRSGVSLAVNASGGSDHILSRLPRDTRESPALGDAQPGTLGDAAADLAFPLPRLAGLDLQRADRPTTAADARTWFGEVNSISRFFDLVITDWGVRPAPGDLALTGLASHVLCLVCRAERHALEEVVALIPALRAEADPPRIVVVSVDVGARGRHDAHVEIAREVGVPLVELPYDAAWSTTIPTPSRRLSLASRSAVLRLASTVMTEAVSSLPSRRPAEDAAQMEPLR